MRDGAGNRRPRGSLRRRGLARAQGRHTLLGQRGHQPDVRPRCEAGGLCQGDPRSQPPAAARGGAGDARFLGAGVGRTEEDRGAARAADRHRRSRPAHTTDLRRRGRRNHAQARHALGGGRHGHRAPGPQRRPDDEDHLAAARLHPGTAGRRNISGAAAGGPRRDLRPGGRRSADGVSRPGIDLRGGQRHARSVGPRAAGAGGLQPDRERHPARQARRSHRRAGGRSRRGRVPRRAQPGPACSRRVAPVDLRSISPRKRARDVEDGWTGARPVHRPRDGPRALRRDRRSLDRGGGNDLTVRLPRAPP